MPTFQEKVAKFLHMTGPAGEAIAEAAEAVQKQADEVSEWKELAENTPADETAETVKAKAAPVQVEIEVEEDDEEAETDEEDEDEEEKEAGDEYFALGDVDMKEYGALMSGVLAEAVRPLSEELAALKEFIEETFGTTKEHDAHRDEGVVLALEAAKEHDARIAALEKENRSLKTTIKEARELLSQLQSDLPRGMGGFVASASKETELEDDDPRLKEGPQADPMGSFLNDFVMKK
jgi:hypothetical protein